MASRIESIMIQMRSALVCSNPNRVAILHLLKKTRGNKLQVEKIAYKLGLSHRTILYHLDVLRENGLVEVRKFRSRGSKVQRSVWGLKPRNTELKYFINEMYTNFPQNKLENMVNKNLNPR